jgi:hypothetical protein
MILKRKQDKIKHINFLLTRNFSDEVSNKMLLVIFQKYIGLSYGEGKRLIDNELKFLKSL